MAVVLVCNAASGQKNQPECSSYFFVSPKPIISGPVLKTQFAPKRGRDLTALISSATTWSFLAVGLRVGANVAILPLVVRTLPTEHLALWYLFVSLGSFANLADFGLGNTITRAASFFWAGATEFRPQGVEPIQGQQSPNYLMLRRLLASARRLYRLIGVSALVLMLVLGYFWLNEQKIKIADLPVEFVWTLYALGVSANLYTNYWNCFLLGIGRVKESQRAMALGQMLYLVFMVVGLLAGGGLLVLAIGAAIPGLVNRILARNILLSVAGPLREKEKASADLMNSLWPNTWRFGCVMLGAYFIYNSNLWLCSRFLGLRTTAEYGLTFQICQVLVQVSSIFVTVKLPVLNQYRTQGATREVTQLFIRQIRKGILIYLIGAAALFTFGQPLLNLIGSKTHILPGAAFAFMLGYLFLEFHHSQYAGLVMTENSVPFVKPAIFSGLAIFVIGFFAVKQFGMWGLLITTALVQASFNNWWTVWRGLQGLGVHGKDYWKQFLRPHRSV